MALTLPDVRTAVVTQLATVAGVGNVYRYRRRVNDEAAFQRIYVHQPTGWPNAWFVSLATATPRVSERGTGFQRIGGGSVGDTLTTYTLQIEGHYGHDDERETQTTFEDLVDAVALSFDRVGLITANASAFFQSPTQVQQVSYIEVAGRFLMHYARIAVAVRGKTTP